MWHVSERWEILTRFWLENLMGRNHFEDLGMGRRIILKRVLTIWTGFIQLRVGTSGRLLSIQYEPSGSIKGGKFQTS
jgi:hypothetical protein